MVPSVHQPSLLVASSGTLSTPLRKDENHPSHISSRANINLHGAWHTQPQGKSLCSMNKTEELKRETLLSAAYTLRLTSLWPIQSLHAILPQGPYSQVLGGDLQPYTTIVIYLYQRKYLDLWFPNNPVKRSFPQTQQLTIVNFSVSVAYDKMFPDTIETLTMQGYG